MDKQSRHKPLLCARDEDDFEAVKETVLQFPCTNGTRAR